MIGMTAQLAVMLIGELARAQDVSVLYAAHAASTHAFKTTWTTGYTNDSGFYGNFAKTQYLMAMLAESVYEDGEKNRATLWNEGFVVERSFNSGAAEGVIARDLLGRVRVLVIEGTHAVEDLLTDLFSAPTLFTSDASYHRGFYGHASRVYDEVAGDFGAQCGAASTTTTPALWVTGHSLGGAAASIVSVMLDRKKGCKLNGVATFGSPRAGLKNWRSLYNSSGRFSYDLQYRSSRWVNDNDPIYCLPPGGGWRHVGIESQISSGGSVYTGTNISGSKCSEPDGWLKALQNTAFALSDLTPFWQEVFNAWKLRLIEIAFNCSSGIGWDDVWSIGQCTLVDVQNRLLNRFGLSPRQLLSEAIRLVALGNHWSKNYRSALSDVFWDAPFEDSFVLANMRKVTVSRGPGLNSVVQLTDMSSNRTCNLNYLPCEFYVPKDEPIAIFANWNSLLTWGGVCEGQSTKTCELSKVSEDVKATISIGQLY